MGTFFAILVKGNSAIVASGCQYSTTKSRMLDQKSSSFSKDETVNQTVKSISFWQWDRPKTETLRIPQNKGPIHKSEDLFLSQDIGKRKWWNDRCPHFGRKYTTFATELCTYHWKSMSFVTLHQNWFFTTLQQKGWFLCSKWWDILNLIFLSSIVGATIEIFMRTIGLILKETPGSEYVIYGDLTLICQYDDNWKWNRKQFSNT